MVFMATKMENQLLSLLKVYKVQILSKPALNKFFTSFLKKMQNMNLELVANKSHFWSETTVIFF